MLDWLKKTEVYKSIFRHSYQDTQRNRALQVVDNVFLHLHPVRIARHATNVGYTWGMGGISFLLFLILTITGIFVLRVKRPAAHRPYRAFGYPVVPALYVAGASIILMVLFLYQAPTTWPGLGIVATGVPVYLLWRRGSGDLGPEPTDPIGDQD